MEWTDPVLGLVAPIYLSSGALILLSSLAQFCVLSTTTTDGHSLHNMALLAPEIMSTTSTYLQLDELNERSLQNHIPNRREVPRHIYLQSGTLEAATLQEIPSPSSELESQSQYQLESQRPGLTPIGEQLQKQELKQRALLLKAAREQYTLVTDHDIPSISHKGEILIKVAAIGLNPIDWKAPYVSYSFLTEQILRPSVLT